MHNNHVWVVNEYVKEFERNRGTVVECSFYGAECPWIEICTGQQQQQKKYYVTRVVHLGKALYSYLLHSTLRRGIKWQPA